MLAVVVGVHTYILHTEVSEISGPHLQLHILAGP